MKTITKLWIGLGVLILCSPLGLILPEYFKSGDVLTLNNSKVFPARLYGTKKGSGGKVEIFLLRKFDNDNWEALVRPGRRLQPGTIVEMAEGRLTAMSGKILSTG